MHSGESVFTDATQLSVSLAGRPRRPTLWDGTSWLILCPPHGVKSSTAEGRCEVATTSWNEYTNPDGVIPEKRQWRTVVSCAARAIGTRDYVEPAYEGVLALAVPNSARTFYRLRAHPNGRRLFRDKPDILEVLRDDTYLSSLPVGTLGHAYRSFMTLHQIHPGLFDDHAVIRSIAEKNHWSEDYYYMMTRGSAVHDLFHTIGGYGADAAGEAANIGFHSGQAEPAGSFLRSGWFLSVIYPGAPLRRKLRYFWQAVERGRRADNLMAAPWEELLDKPIDEVRDLLGVAPTAVAHPEGQLYSPLSLPGAAPPPHWDYEAIMSTG
jgi:ubiquinone biosynthesis protein Coq4